MLSGLVEGLTAWVSSVVEWGGAGGIFLVALFENLFPPTPSEWLYPLTGKLTFDGEISLLAVIVAGVAGSLVGATIWYALGARLGEARARDFVERFGTWRIGRFSITLFKAQEYDQALDLFRKHGGIIVLVARIMPMVHGVVSIPAGVVRMPLIPFYLYSAIGATLWIAPLALLGNFLGSQWENILTWIDVYQNVWYALIGLLIVYWLYRRWRNRTPQTNS